jgi:adenylate kinase family enzyme
MSPIGIEDIPAPRIVVVGTAGCGKTTFARRIAQRLRIPHVELDALHWEHGWQPAPLGVLRDRTVRALSGGTWVVDGNYSKVRDIVWGRADTVVWLDYSLPVILRRLIWRTLHRCLTHEELWRGNRETLSKALLSRESIVLWALRTYARRRREYPVLAVCPEHRHLEFVSLRSPHAADEWVAGLEPRSSTIEVWSTGLPVSRADA